MADRFSAKRHSQRAVETGEAPARALRPGGGDEGPAAWRGPGGHARRTPATLHQAPSGTAWLHEPATDKGNWDWQTRN